MALAEVEFELSAQQYERMNFPGLQQGRPLAAILDAGVLLPDLAASSWFTVQPERLPPAFVQVGRGAYAFTGRIVEADIVDDEDFQSATVWLNCGVVHVRATSAPNEDGRLPYGTWETRTLTGVARLQGIVEDEFLFAYWIADGHDCVGYSAAAVVAWRSQFWAVVRERRSVAGTIST